MYHFPILKSSVVMLLNLWTVFDKHASPPCASFQKMTCHTKDSVIIILHFKYHFYEKGLLTFH
jgi:hypothetical protein